MIAVHANGGVASDIYRWNLLSVCLFQSSLSRPRVVICLSLYHRWAFTSYWSSTELHLAHNWILSSRRCFFQQAESLFFVERSTGHVEDCPRSTTRHHWRCNENNPCNNRQSRCKVSCTSSVVSCSTIVDNGLIICHRYDLYLLPWHDRWDLGAGGSRAPATAHVRFIRRC